MRRVIGSLLCFALVGLAFAQVGGGSAGYSGHQDKNAREISNRQIDTVDLPPPGCTYVDASVLANVKADEYVVVFGIVQEGETPADCGQKIDATIHSFKSALKGLGVADNDMFVDFIVQNRIYDFEVNDKLAKEKLAGFELKKNVSIHYKDRDLLDKIVIAAAANQIFDLIKVDYVVKDTMAVRTKLMAVASAIVKKKAADLHAQMGFNMRGPTQMIAQRFATYFPTDLYDSYVAVEGADVSVGYDRQNIVQRVRKAQTMYFNPLDARLFDRVINPIVLEPVVQFTLYLKVQYTTGNANLGFGISDRGTAKPKKG